MTKPEPVESSSTLRTSTSRAPGPASRNGASPSARTTPPTSKGSSARCTAPSAISTIPSSCRAAAAQGRYAGSLVPLDFGERQQAKQAVLVTIGNGVQVDTRMTCPPVRRLVEFGKPGSPDTLRDLEGLAVNGGLDSCILKARVASDDPIPDLAERVMKWSPKCAVFEVVNVVKNQPIKPIEPNGGGAGAPSPEQLFREWRMTAPAPKAPHEVVSALFARALGGVNQAVAPDFGVTTIESRADRVLASLASRRNGAQG